MPTAVTPTSPRTPVRSSTPVVVPATRRSAPDSSRTILHSLDRQSTSKSSKKLGTMALLAIVIILAGVGSGYVLAGTNSGSGTNIDPDSLPSAGGTQAVQTATEEGINNDELFPDTATGELQVNDGTFTSEGTHMLIREGGPDQTAFLFSSYVDLEKYVGKQVQIKGQTNTAQTAGWLLEVGWIKVN